MEDSKIVYELNVFLYSDLQEYPKKIIRRSLGLFSSMERVNEAIQGYIEERNKYDEPASNKKIMIHYFNASKTEIDVNKLYYFYIFDKNGTLHSEGDFEDNFEAFDGRETENCKFRVGDFVHFMRKMALQIGIVAEQPPSKEFISALKKKGKTKEEIADKWDDSYLVIWNNGNLEYAHMGEDSLFKMDVEADPLNKKLLKNELLEYLAGCRKVKNRR